MSLVDDFKIGFAVGVDTIVSCFSPRKANKKLSKSFDKFEKNKRKAEKKSERKAK